MSTQIFYKENTGILNPRDYKCDYFILGRKALEENGAVTIQVKFYRTLEPAQLSKPPNSFKTIVIPKEIADTFPTVSEGVGFIFIADTVTTAEGKIISLQGATPINE